MRSVHLPPLRQRLAEMQKAAAAVVALLAPGQQVRAEAWSVALGTLGGRHRDLEALHWQVKLAVLNRSLP